MSARKAKGSGPDKPTQSKKATATPAPRHARHDDDAPVDEATAPMPSADEDGEVPGTEASPNTGQDGQAPATSGQNRNSSPTRVRRARATTSAAVLVLDLVVFGMVVTGVHGPARFVLGLAFGLVVPGWSIVGPLRFENATLEVALTVATSLCTLIIAAQLLITVGAWRLTGLQIVVALVCLPSLLWQSLDHRRLIREPQ